MNICSLKRKYNLKWFTTATEDTMSPLGGMIAYGIIIAAVIIYILS